MATEATTTNASTPEGVVTQVDSVDGVVESESLYEFDPADVGLDTDEVAGLTEESLTGTDDETSDSEEETKEETQETSGSDDESEVKETTEETKSDDMKDEEETKSSTEEKTADSESSEDTTKPPKGFVPLSALHEARDANKDLRETNRSLMQRLDRLEAQATQPQKPAQQEAESDFKVLTKAEYDELADDNPTDAVKYLRDLKEYEDHQREIKESEQQQQNTESYIEEVVTDVSRAMEAELPGILDPESDTYKGLVEFAPEIGFESDMYYLTNPATQVILPGETEPLLLGDQALSMLKILNSAKTKIAEASTPKVDEAALRTQIESELRETIQAELVEKFKTDSGSQEFRSTKQVNKSEDDTPTFSGKVLTEAQLAKLSDKEYEQYLAGE